MPTDEDIASSSYILSFYNDIENLTNSYATYLNVLVKLKDRYNLDKNGITEKEKRQQTKRIEEEDEAALLEVAEGIRVWIARCYVKLTTLKNKIPEMKANEKKIHKLYEDAISNSVIKKETVEDFVLEINQLFVEGVLKNLLLKSKDIYREFLQAE